MFDSVGQSEVFPRTLDLRRIDVARNMRRYYRLGVQRDLFGRACLMREWGRIGARGQSLIERYEDEGKAIASLHAIGHRSVAMADGIRHGPVKIIHGPNTGLSRKTNEVMNAAA